MPLTFEILSWLFVFALAIHNLEEAIWLPTWSRIAGKWHPVVTDREFRFAVILLTVLAAAVAWIAIRQGKESAGAYLLCGYALAMLLNVVFPHLLGTLALRRYMPGTATAIIFILPTTFALIRYCIAEDYIKLNRFLLLGPLTVVGIVISIPALFWLGRRANLAL